MAMGKDDFLKTLTDIGTCEDETQRRTMLASLNTEATTLFDNFASLTQQNETLKKDKEDLRSANMKLFMQVGNTKTQQQQQQDTTGIHNNNEPEKKLTYENLFDEKGGLK